MNTVYEELMTRGLIKQITFEDEFKKLVRDEKISVYLGIDPTADSIHIGHFIPLMLMSYFQKHGHKPILLIGGGTAMIGDPSGKSDMRNMLTREEIAKNVENIKKQISKFVSFEGNNAAILVNNADWILDLNYMDFISTYGIHFNVNRMLDAECFKMRMEKGLTFFELNYMLMQSYDFLHLFEAEGCKVQLGGDDQWSNMLAGVELIRKIHKNGSFCLTCPLLLNSDGTKMGKTVKGALWLDEKRTTPYDVYQYFRNIEDGAISQVLRMLTFLDMKEINRLAGLPGEKINEAKKIAAYEITKLLHGAESAEKAKRTAEEIFEKGQNSADMPTIIVEKLNFVDNQMLVIELMVLCNISRSKSESKILISQGGVTIDEKKVEDVCGKISIKDFEKGFIVLRKGKKVFVKVILK